MRTQSLSPTNHPSGDPTPSKADMQLTSVLQSTARLLGVKFLDHLVLGSADCKAGRGFVSVMEFELTEGRSCMKLGELKRIPLREEGR